MTESKQDRILDALKQRITQLEEELRGAKERLKGTQAQNEEVNKEMDLLRAEAHDVVGQWEKEAIDLRKRLDVSEMNNKKTSATIRELTTAKGALEEKVSSLEKIVAEYSNSLQSRKQETDNLRQMNEEMTTQLESARKDFSQAMQQSKEYEELTAAMQKELVTAAEAEKTYLRDIESLKASLSHRTGEVEALRAQKDEITMQAEKLLHRITELKAVNDQLCDDSEASQRQTKASAVELEDTRAKLSDARTELKELQLVYDSKVDECNNLKAELMRVSNALTDKETTSRQQAALISGLEKDVQELEDAGIVQGKFLEEYQAQKEMLEAELAAAQKSREEIETQFTAVKDIYASTLVEANDLKEKLTKKCDETAAELDKCRQDMTEALQFSDHRCEAAIESVRQLNNSLRQFQIREVTLQEHIERQHIEYTQVGSFYSATVLLAKGASDRVSLLEASVSQKSQEAERALEQYRLLSDIHSTLKSKAESEAEELKEVRKSCAALENKAASSNTKNNQLEERNASLQRDNSWLKEQVEAMRTELGDLDELLNANLNQMEEENEKHVARICDLQHTIEDLREREKENSQKLLQYEQNFEALESEFAAQSKTLEVAESELRSAHEENDKLQQAVVHTTERFEEAELRASELARSNSLLSVQNNTMKEQLRGQEERQSIIIADKRREIDGLRLKINQHVEKTEELTSVAVKEQQLRESAEKALSASKDSSVKLRAALEELKERCASDATSLKQLIEERDELVRDRDVIVERYNRLHDAFRNVKRETNGKVADELRKMLEFSSQQETELQQLRRENIALKKSVTMFVTSAQPRTEPVFVERLNLTEGPLRHPKKRSVTRNTDHVS